MILLTMPVRECIFIYRLFKDYLRGTDFMKGTASVELGYEDSGDKVHYEATHWRMLHKIKNICEKAGINNSIVDIGCGKGLMLEYFSKYAFKKVGG